MGRQKDKGTRRETAVVRMFLAAGLQAQRAPNNLKSRDVDMTLKDGTEFAVEVKDRQQLNVHKELAQVVATWPGMMPAVVWHRTEKREGAKRSVPSGPTIIALRLEDFVALAGRITP